MDSSLVLRCAVCQVTALGLVLQATLIAIVAPLFSLMTKILLAVNKLCCQSVESARAAVFKHLCVCVCVRVCVCVCVCVCETFVF